MVLALGVAAALGVGITLAVLPGDTGWLSLFVPAGLVAVVALRSRDSGWGSAIAALAGGSAAAGVLTAGRNEDSPAAVVTIGTALVFAVLASLPLVAALGGLRLFRR